ncbi:hypothetical protein CC1G_12902 [Coprinopsis cinerea okayama7|uniref:Uncharacterized protein n=1 Tax=Coprinopsis cinerea (strain Okayama-7 / 130 / ATCC MYA-4618 / FGSC 9003) TaxID=240176 RepID=A8N9N4_COPC7|nr:hypothetical protein CC1G_12902 [Coprinopsis cinerea okayama7\|eukprot:XP_001831540.2 hypothetical protein CC1G_12902 [Coprinopsis cinerea okayama7\
MAPVPPSGSQPQPPPTQNATRGDRCNSTSSGEENMQMMNQSIPPPASMELESLSGDGTHYQALVYLKSQAPFDNWLQHHSDFASGGVQVLIRPDFT